MNRTLSIASCVCFVICATLFITTWNWWLFGLSLLFQAGIFAPDIVTNYRKAQRRKE